MNQIELENKMHREGMARAAALMQRNEDEGRAVDNPYATPIMRRYVLPMADMIRAAKDCAGNHMPVPVLVTLGLDENVMAYLAVRNALIYCMNTRDMAHALMMTIATDIHRECVLELFSNEHPANYARINEDLKRKASKDPRHKAIVMKRAAQQEGMDVPEWNQTDKGHVGAWMLELLKEVGMIETTTEQESKTKRVTKVFLSTAALKQIDAISDSCLELMPVRFPFIEKPKDWTSITEGGFHTEASRRSSCRAAVKIHGNSRAALAAYADEDTANLRKAMNILQGTRWAINTEILDVLPLIAKKLETKEVLDNPEVPAPVRPAFLENVEDASTLVGEQADLFKAWKRAMAVWHTNNRLRRTRSGRYLQAIRVATEFKDYANLHFLYQADSRGRLYAQTAGVSPQGSDLQRALLRFAEGKPLGSTGERWFLINGANLFGVDKVTFEERIHWVKQNAAQIIACASAPADVTMWLDADKPMMFLAWAFEFKRYSEDKANFLNYLPIGQDGSCNGLQHYSAMLRDEVGGRAVNLVAAPKPNDIYQQVANKTTELLRASEPCELRDLWLNHGITRKLTKRSVMTLPYGSTKHSCSDFILGDYLYTGAAGDDIPKELYVKAARFLAEFVWEAIGNVVIAAVEGMAWLQRASSAILKENAAQIEWRTPSGFKVIQRYMKSDEVQIRSKLYSAVGLRVYVASDKADKLRHKNGIAPNFIHSLDASHLCLTTIAAAEAGISSLAMIHDDYGTHACDSETLAKLIRQEFVGIYQNNHPLDSFRAAYPNLPKPPAEGSLDVSRVLESPYFFC